MGDDRQHDAVNRSVAEHVERLRARLEAGREEILRQQRSLHETREHMDHVQRFAAQTERHLSDQRGDALGEAEAVA